MDAASLIAAFDSAPMGIALLDTAQRFLYANTAYAARHARPAAALVGTPIAALVPDTLYRRYIEPGLQQALAGQPVAYRLERTDSEHKRVMAVRYFPCRDADQRVWAVLNIGLEISADCGALPPTVEQFDSYWSGLSLDPARTRYRDLRAAQRSLAQSDRLISVGRSAAAMTHDLRAPLGTLTSDLKLLRARLAVREDAGLQRLFDRCERALGVCNRLASSLLDYSRPFALDLRTVWLDRWVGEVIELYHPPLPAHIDWHAGGAGRTRFDRELLRRALTNLLDNAALACAAGERRGRVWVRSRCEGERAVVDVLDDGPGLPPALTAAPTAEAVGELPGFGLSIAHQVIRRHGGELQLRNRPEGGGWISLCLPLAADRPRAA